MLTELMNAPEKLDHDYLDSAGPDGLTRGIRSMFIDAGLLEPRDHHLARFEKWIVEVSAEIPNAKLRVSFVQFARWRHVRELRKKQSPLPASLTVSRRRELRLILDLMSWINDQDQAFGSLTQSDVDRWRSFGAKEKYRVNEFLAWAPRNRLVRRIEIHRPKRTDLNVIGFSDAKRTEILENLLDEQCPWPALIRFSALLVLLFGARPLQITRLKVSDIFFRGPDAYVRLGPEPVLLPEVLTQLASAILNDRTAIRQFTSEEETHWLLPGTVTGYPMSSTALAVRLRKLGIPTSTARTTAMSMLTQSLPPTIVARLTGTTQGTAIRWMEAVAASNARYAAWVMPSYEP
jgi:integrase